MKSCDEMAKDVFRRIEEHKTERRERRKKTVRMLIVVACFCVSITVVASGAAAVYYVIQETEPQVASSETVSEIISSQEPENKEYEVKVYFASGSEEFAGKFKGVQVGGRKSEIAISKNIDAYDRTITKTILGVEEEYSLVSVWSNEYSEQQIIRYRSDEMYKHKHLYIKAETGEIVYYNDIGLYSQQPVDRYVKKMRRSK